MNENKEKHVDTLCQRAFWFYIKIMGRHALRNLRGLRQCFLNAFFNRRSIAFPPEMTFQYCFIT